MIVKGVLRIGKTTIFKKKEIVQFYHVDRAFRMFHSSRKLSHIISSEAEVHGFIHLSNDDKERLINHITVMKPIIENLNQRNTNQEIIPYQTSQVAPISENLIRGKHQQKTCCLKPHKSPDIKILFTNADQLTASKKIELEHRISREKPVIIAVCEYSGQDP